MPQKGQKSGSKVQAPPAKSTRLSRAKNERMYFMGRAAEAEEAAAAFIVSGQSGKIWTVIVPREKPRSKAAAHRNSKFRCNCPDNLIRKGTCKHMIFVCLRILKIPEEQLQCVEYGGDLDVSLLHEALGNAPGEVENKYTAPSALKARLKAIAGDFEKGGEIPKVEPRLPEEGDSCPICYEDLLDGTALVHCSYGCGKPVHTECFTRYSEAQKGRYERDEVSDNKLKCVTCRTDWVMQATNVIGKRGMLIGRRAINLAEEMPDEFVLPRSRSRPGSSSTSKSRSKASKSKASKSKAAGSSSKRGASSSEAGSGVREGRVTRKRTKGEPSGRTTRSDTKARRSARLAGEAVAGTVPTNSRPSSKQSTKVAKGKISKGKNTKGKNGGQGSKSASKRTRSSTRTATA